MEVMNTQKQDGILSLILKPFLILQGYDDGVLQFGLLSF
jgi:hypothetical protein